NPADSPVLILSVSSSLIPGTELSDVTETILPAASGHAMA
ncbi:hypothetical protein PSYPI_47968, partial [Pseudomonas syringae pv. pisi str. 1704B]